MKKLCVYIALLLLASCTTALEHRVFVESIVNKQNYLDVTLQIEGMNSEEYNQLKKLSSKRLVCSSSHFNRVDTQVSNFDINFLESTISICKNDDNRMCKPVNISNTPIQLNCQLIFSSMLGNTIKSKEFEILNELGKRQ